MKRKLVLDTNVLVSALGWKGKERIVFERCMFGDLILVESRTLLNELETVIFRHKFDFIPSWKKLEFISLLANFSKIIDPLINIDILEDSADNRVIECAISGQVDFIVSGDNHLLKLKKIADIEIMKADIFLKKY